MPLLTALAVTAALLTPRDAWAYLDPGTGSFVLQMAIAGVLAGMFTIKVYWQRLKAWFAGRTAPSAPEAPAGRADEPK